jgi:hypothetical protein
VSTMTEPVSDWVDTPNGGRDEAEQPDVAQEAHTAPPTSRLILCNPGQPKEPLPDDIPIEELLERIKPGGHVTLHERAGGAMVGTLLPYADPRMRFFEAGEKHARRQMASQLGQTGVARTSVENHFRHIKEAHFHF